jgi:hypothetical protein
MVGGDSAVNLQFLPYINEGDLKKLSEGVKREEARRANLAREAAIKKREQRHQVIVDNINALLSVQHEHDRTSCHDNDACNVGRCTRCTLLDIRKYPLGGPGDIEIQVVAVNNPIK